MKKLPSIENIVLTTVAGEILRFQYGKLKRRKGKILLHVFLDDKHLENEMTGFLKTIGHDRGAVTENASDLMSMSATADFDQHVTLTNVAFVTAKTSTHKGIFESYGTLNIWPGNIPQQEVWLTGFSVEGLKILHRNTTRTAISRRGQGRHEEHMIRSAWDFSETILHFNWQEKDYAVPLTVIQSGKNRLAFRLENYVITRKVYHELQGKLETFLSLLCGNNVKIASAAFYTEGGMMEEKESFPKISAKRYDNYFPARDFHFRNDGIFQSFMDCFDNYLLMDEHLQLGHIVSLMNGVNRTSFDLQYFAYIIILEKLAFHFQRSALHVANAKTILEPGLFKTNMAAVNDMFDRAFDAVKKTNRKAFVDLKARLNQLNTINRNDGKFAALLTYAEIEETEAIRHIFPHLRNATVHEGNIETAEASNSLDNYFTLKKLLKDILANLIQYKGVRYVDIKGHQIFTETKTGFAHNLQQLRKNGSGNNTMEGLGDNKG